MQPFLEGLAAWSSVRITLWLVEAEFWRSPPRSTYAHIALLGIASYVLKNETFYHTTGVSYFLLMGSVLLTKPLFLTPESHILPSTCHPHCVKDISNTRVQNETYFLLLPPLNPVLPGVCLREQHFPPFSYENQEILAHSLPPTYSLLVQFLSSPGNFAPKCLLILPPSRWFYCPESSLSLLFATAMVKASNSPLALLSLSKPQGWSCFLPAPNSPEASRRSQDTSPTFRFTLLPPHKGLTLALYMPCVACHLPSSLAIDLHRKTNHSSSLPKAYLGTCFCKGQRVERNYSAFLWVILDF